MKIKSVGGPAGYLREIEKFQDFAQVEAQQLRDYAEFSEKMIGYKTARNLSDRTIYKVASMIKVFLDFCALFDIIESPHFLSMGHGFKKGKGPEMEFFDREDPKDKEIIENVLWNPHLSLRDRAALFILFDTGLRASELCGLNIEDVDLTERWVHVRKDVGKGGKPRYVPFTEKCSMWLNLYVTGLQTCLPGIENPRPLFSNLHGRRMTPDVLWKRFNALGKTLSITQKINPHKWRHSLCSFLVLKEGIAYAAEVMGHDSIQTTKGYTHFRPSSIKRKYDEITALA